MADLDLSIVVRARDLLSAELKRMGTNLQEVARIGRAAFAQVDAAPVAAAIRSTEAAVRALGASNASLRPLEGELETARARLEAMREAATRAGGQLSALDRQKLDQLEREVREGEAALVRFRGAAERAASGLGTSFRAAGAAVRSALLPILPLLTLGGAAFAAADSVRQAAEFEKALAGISAEAGITGTALDALKRRALETTRALGIPEAKAASALLKAITDGAKDAADGLGIFDAGARLASATSGDLTRTVDVLNSVLNAFREQGLGAAEAADVLFTTSVRAGKLDVDELAGGIGAVLPLVGGLKVSFEELGAIIVSSTKAGGGFQQGMQAVRAVLGVLTGDSEEAAAALGGLDFEDAIRRAGGLVPLLRNIAVELGGDAAAIRRVFPDARAFGVIFSLLKDGGRGLAEELEHLQRAAGGVEEALGNRLKNPAEQLGIVFNRLRSEFSEAFGGAFFASVGRAVEELGGLESASKRVGDSARAIGDSFGSIFPAVLEFARVTVGAVQAAISSMRLIVEELDFVRDLFASFEGIKLFSTLDQDSLDDVNAALAEVEQSIERVKRGVEGRNGVEIFNEENLRDALSAIPQDLSRIDIEAVLKSENVEEGLEKIKRELETDKIEIEATIRGERGLAELKRRFFAAREELRRDGQGLFDDALAGIDLALGRIGTVEIPTRTFEEARAALEDVRFSIEQGEAQLVGLAQSAQDAFRLLESPARTGALAAFAEQARTLQGELDANRAGAKAIGLELEGLRNARIAELRKEIAEVESGLRDARSEAELLGITDPAQLEEAMRATGRGADFATSRIEALRAELEALEGRAEQVGEALETVTRIDLGRSLRLDRTLRDVFGSDATGPVLAQALELGVSAARRVRTGLLQEARARRIDNIGELLGLGPAENEILLQVVLAGVDAARLGLDQLATERDALTGQAIALGISIESLDNEQLRKAIARAQSLIEREVLTIQLGLDVDVDDATLNEAIERARIAVERATADVGKAGREREAIRLRISVDSETLEADLIRARDQIAAFQEEVRTFSEENRFLVGAARDFAGGFAAGIRDVATGIKDADEAAREFFSNFIGNAFEAIIQTQALELAARAVSGITGQETDVVRAAVGLPVEEASQAAAGAALEAAAVTAAATLGTGAVTAAGTLQGAATTAAATLAGGGTAAGAAIISAATQAAAILAGASAVGVAGETGIVFPAARGVAYGDEPGMAVRYALGGVPDVTRRAWTEAVPFALGGVPDAHRTLWTEVAPFALGGVPDLTRTVAYRSGGSPFLDRIIDRPTIAAASSFAGSAIVPLSGGGVTTPSGRKLPVTRQGSELVVQRFARGGFQALFGEAGPEAVMRTERTTSGRLGLRAADGGVLPFFRDSSRRLGVVPFQTGGTFGEPQRTASTLQVSVPISIAMERGDPEARRVASAFQEPRAREQIEAAVLDVIRRSGTYRAEVRGDRVS